MSVFLDFCIKVRDTDSRVVCFNKCRVSLKHLNRLGTMIEAVNASLALSAVKPTVLQAASPSSQGTKPSVQPVARAPEIPYISLYITVDDNYDKAVLQIRDSSTGDVQDQFPTESRLAQIARNQRAIEQKQSFDVSTEQPAQGETTQAQAGSANTVTTVQDAVSVSAANATQQGATIPPQNASNAFIASAASTSTPSPSAPQVSVLA